VENWSEHEFKTDLVPCWDRDGTNDVQENIISNMIFRLVLIHILMVSSPSHKFIMNDCPS